jgi:hypothetical protein
MHISIKFIFEHILGLVILHFPISIVKDVEHWLLVLKCQGGVSGPWVLWEYYSWPEGRKKVDCHDLSYRINILLSEWRYKISNCIKLRGYGNSRNVDTENIKSMQPKSDKVVAVSILNYSCKNCVMVGVLVVVTSVSEGCAVCCNLIF